MADWAVKEAAKASPKYNQCDEHTLGPPRGKRTETVDAVVPKEEDAGQGGECSFAGPSGTSGGGASSDVIVIDSESEDYSVEDAAPEDNQTVRKQAVVVASTVGNTKTAKPSRSMLAVLARQRRLDATVAQYRRLVEMEGDDTHSSASNVTSTASSSVTPRSAGYSAEDKSQNDCQDFLVEVLAANQSSADHYTSSSLFLIS
ncbi:uncharacterized protein LOC144752464 [Lissotriton helveticus]